MSCKRWKLQKGNLTRYIPGGQSETIRKFTLRLVLKDDSANRYLRVIPLSPCVEGRQRCNDVELSLGDPLRGPFRLSCANCGTETQEWNSIDDLVEEWEALIMAGRVVEDL